MALAALNLLQVSQQRLDGLNAGVLAVAVNDLPRQGLGNAALQGDLLPRPRAALAQPALDVIDDGFHAPESNPNFGTDASPNVGTASGQSIGVRPRDTLAANIQALMENWTTPNKHKALCQASGIPNGTLERIEKATVSAGIDWLEPLARALDVEPWELLVPPDKRVQLRALFDALQAAATTPPKTQSKRNHTDRWTV